MTSTHTHTCSHTPLLYSGSDALPHTEVISASEGEAGAAKTVKLVTQHLREYMLSLYQQRKTLELRVLGRLLQIST
ncbi:hypothetical protein SARC_18214, partial [Sphaeroforma arctica JP610]